MRNNSPSPAGGTRGRNRIRPAMLALDQTVTWGDGLAREKTGCVIEVVKPGRVPHLHYQARKTPRHHTSYVVKVGKKTFWPRTGTLEQCAPRGRT